MPAQRRERDVWLTAWLTARHAPCPACGYDLRGLRCNVCPECGARLELAVQVRARRLMAGRLSIGLLGGMAAYEVLKVVESITWWVNGAPLVELRTDLALETAGAVLIGGYALLLLRANRHR